MSCLEPDDLLTYKYRCATIQVCCDEETIQQALDAAQEKVEAYTGQKFCPEETCIYLNGKKDTTLFTTEATALPILELESVSILEYGEDDVVVDLEELYVEKHTIRRRDGTCWPCGERNIKICGTFGKNLPEGVKSAIIVLALEAMTPGSSGLQPAGVAAASWNDFSIRYRVDATFNEIKNSVGFHQLDTVLAQYVNPLQQVQFGVVDSCAPKCCDTRRNCGNC